MKKVTVAVAAVLVVLLIYFFGTGFLKNGTTYLDEYSVSADGSEITLNISTTSSIGYIRAATVHQQEGGKLYIDCYSAFGGFNGSVGAKSRFTFPLKKDTKIIGLYRTANYYEEVLQKDDNGVWQRLQ